MVSGSTHGPLSLRYIVRNLRAVLEGHAKKSKAHGPCANLDLVQAQLVQIHLLFDGPPKKNGSNTHACVQTIKESFFRT